MSATRRFVALAACLLAAVFAVPATASAAAPVSNPTSALSTLTLSGDIDGVLLHGTCPGAASDLKNIYAVQNLDWMWAPIRLADPNLVSLNKVLVPYEISASGPGLKTRHLIPGGEPLVRPGPTPRNLIGCTFTGSTADGVYEVTVRGTVLPFPGRLIPFPVPPKV